MDPQILLRNHIFKPDGEPIGVRSFKLVDGPELALSDAQQFTTRVGVTSVLFPGSGETRTTSAASLVMLGKDREVIWHAP